MFICLSPLFGICFITDLFSESTFGGYFLKYFMLFYTHTHISTYTHIHTLLPTFYIRHSSHIENVKVDHQITSHFFWQPSMKSSEVNYIICFRKELENNWSLYSSCLVPNFPLSQKAFNLNFVELLLFIKWKSLSF